MRQRLKRLAAGHFWSSDKRHCGVGQPQAPAHERYPGSCNLLQTTWRSHLWICVVRYFFLKTSIIFIKRQGQQQQQSVESAQTPGDSTEDFLGTFSCTGVVCHCLLLNSLHICAFSIPSLFFHQRTLFFPIFYCFSQVFQSQAGSYLDAVKPSHPWFSLLPLSCRPIGQSILWEETSYKITSIVYKTISISVERNLCLLQNQQLFVSHS